MYAIYVKNKLTDEDVGFVKVNGERLFDRETTHREADFFRLGFPDAEYTVYHLVKDFRP